MIDISIIIVNFNTRELLRNCLLSIHKTVQGISYEIIVVDNASSDESVSLIRSEFPDTILLVNDVNRGFAAANNQALKIMKGRYALLLNSDTVLTEGAVSELFLFMERHPEAAIACGQLLNEDGSKQNSIACFPNAFSLLANTVLLEYLFPSKFPSKRYPHYVPIEIDSGIGACLIVRKKAIDYVGMLDERYFFFFEETDWARSMKNAGWKVFFVPSANIYHIQGASIGDRFPSRMEFYRSRYQYFRKWNGTLLYLTYISIVFVRLIINWLFTAVSNVATLRIHSNLRRKALLYSKLIAWHIKGCPGKENKS